MNPPPPAVEALLAGAAAAEGGKGGKGKPPAGSDKKAAPRGGKGKDAGAEAAAAAAAEETIGSAFVPLIEAVVADYVAKWQVSGRSAQPPCCVLGSTVGRGAGGGLDGAPASPTAFRPAGTPPFGDQSVGSFPPTLGAWGRGKRRTASHPTNAPKDRDESSNAEQRFDPEMAKEELRPLVFDEVREQVGG